ncbi:CDP-alcohol phosphatidyltransferase family protein [bacterium SCSIO 12696]|nr:CDP-alcohol phosphatidyltransferase family protein [bacterium SCSIO 12696]
METFTKEKIFSIPNILSLTRLFMVPVLLWLAWRGDGSTFLLLLAVSLLTDCFDGFLARTLGQTTELGAKLDTWADVLTYGAMAFGLMWAWPDQFHSERWFVLLAIVANVPPIIVCLARFGCFPSYHTWAAKGAALLLAPAFFWLTLFEDSSWPFRVVVLLHVWVAIEEVIITFMLKEWRCNIPSVFHLMVENRRKRPRVGRLRED